jgi:hypothetical protein
MKDPEKVFEARKKRTLVKKYQRKTYRPTNRMRMCYAAIKTIPNVGDEDAYELAHKLLDYGFTGEEISAAMTQAHIDGVI